MSDRSSDSTRRVLEESLARVRAELSALAPGNPEGAGAAVPQYGKRSGDHIAEALDHRRNMLASQNLRRQEEAIERALEKLEAHTYGQCDRCGGPIGDERLQALPWATLCIDCKRKDERVRR